LSFVVERSCTTYRHVVYLCGLLSSCSLPYSFSLLTLHCTVSLTVTPILEATDSADSSCHGSLIFPFRCFCLPLRSSPSLPAFQKEQATSWNQKSSRTTRYISNPLLSAILQLISLRLPTYRLRPLTPFSTSMAQIHRMGSKTRPHLPSKPRWRQLRLHLLPKNCRRSSRQKTSHLFLSPTLRCHRR